MLLNPEDRSLNNEVIILEKITVNIITTVTAIIDIT